MSSSPAQAVTAFLGGGVALSDLEKRVLGYLAEQGPTNIGVVVTVVASASETGALTPVAQAVDELVGAGTIIKRDDNMLSIVGDARAT